MSMNERANVFAFVVVALIAFLFVLLATQHKQIPIVKDYNSRSRANAITFAATMRSLREGWQEFSKGGLSLYSGLWVCNAFMPPLANEIDTNGEEFLKGKLSSLFKKISKSEGYAYGSDFNVSLGIPHKKEPLEQLNVIFSMPKNRIDINVRNVQISLSSKLEFYSEKRNFSFNYAFLYPYRTWSAYKAYYEWAQSYLPKIGERLCEQLSKINVCRFRGCAEASYVTIIDKGYVLSQMDLNVIDLNSVVFEQNQYLNSIMSRINFKCRYKINQELKDVIIARAQRCETCNCGAGKQISAENALSACGCFEPKHGFSCPKRYIIGPWIAKRINVPSYNDIKSCTNCKEEEVVASPYVLFEFDFICEDQENSIPMQTGIEPYTLKIGVLGAIAKTCVPQLNPLGK